MLFGRTGAGKSTLIETLTRGKTPGKMALDLKVVRPDGGPISLGRAVGRYFAKIVSGIILMIGYIMAGFDSEKRALHDMMCDTRVIKVSKPPL